LVAEVKSSENRNRKKNVQIIKQELSYRRQKESCFCKIIHDMQRCYGTVRFIIYNTDSKSSGCYSTLESTFKSSVTTKTQPTYELINQFL